MVIPACEADSIASPQTTAQMLHAVAATTPTLISVSMVDVPCNALRTAAL